MWMEGSKLSREEHVNLLIHTSVKKETMRQAHTDVLNRSLGSSLANRALMRVVVKGLHLGHFKDGGARFAMPSRATLTCASSMDQEWPCRMC